MSRLLPEAALCSHASSADGPAKTLGQSSPPMDAGRAFGLSSVVSTVSRCVEPVSLDHAVVGNRAIFADRQGFPDTLSLIGAHPRVTEKEFDQWLSATSVFLAIQVEFLAG